MYHLHIHVIHAKVSIVKAKVVLLIFWISFSGASGLVVHDFDIVLHVLRDSHLVVAVLLAEDRESLERGGTTLAVKRTVLGVLAGAQVRDKLAGLVAAFTVSS